MDPPDAAPLPIIAVASWDAADDAALADLDAGRIIGDAAVVRWLGGWHLGRMTGEGGVRLTAPPDRHAPPSGDALPSMPLVWTDSAIADCHRLRCRLAERDPAAERALASALVATMIALTVDGPGAQSGTMDIPMLPSLALRIRIEDGRIAILGLRWTVELHVDAAVR